MIKHSIFIVAFLLLFSTAGVSAQEAWTLEKCINYALENNISIKRQEIQTEIQENELEQSKLNRLPDLNAQSRYGHNYGFTWVQERGANVDVNTRSFSIGAGSSVNVFNGFSKANTIKKNNVDLLVSMAQTDEIKNNIALQISSQYVQILFDKELLNVAKEQYKVTKMQVERTQKLVDAGTEAKGSYLEMKSQAAKEYLNVTLQENNLSLSLLNLAQLLDLDVVEGFDIVTPEMPEIEVLELDAPGSVYTQAVGIMPQIKGADFGLKSSMVGVKIAKGGYYPSLDINGQWGARANWLMDDPGNVNRSLSDQINSTKSTYIGATLNIPIFNKFQTRNNVQRAQIRVMDAQYALDQEKLKLRKEIQQAYADAKAAYNKYISSKEAVESFKESFRYTEQKFNVGLVNSVDYNVAKTDFTRAQSDLLQSKYEYILRNKILNFYKGIPLNL